jgi:hypothetical protein
VVADADAPVFAAIAVECGVAVNHGEILEFDAGSVESHTTRAWLARDV